MAPAASTWLVGTGPHAEAYAKVLKHLVPEDFVVVGRSVERARRFAETLQLDRGRVLAGGIKSAIAGDAFHKRKPTFAIISVTVDELADCAIALLEAGVENILLEKPGGRDLSDVIRIQECVERVSVSHKKPPARVFVAYNRRFYASVLQALELIRDDGGVQTFHFDFTEWPATVRKSSCSDEVKKRWLFANSSHVIDLAFFLGSRPKEVTCTRSGEGLIDFHPSASAWTGSGVSEKGALFSFHANWAAPGRWGLEINTCKRKLVFRPLEALQVMEHGSIAVSPIALEDDNDVRFKPGMLLQTRAFLFEQDHANLLSLEQHVDLCKLFHSRLANESKWTSVDGSTGTPQAIVCKGGKSGDGIVREEVVLVGVGNIGLRHLESLTRVRVPLSVHVVDADPKALKRAQETIAAVKTSPFFDVSYGSNLDSLAKEDVDHVDLVIIATTSMPRRMIAERLWALKPVRAMLLEKVVFPRVQDYDEVSELAKQLNTRLFVNVCHRHDWVEALRKEAKSPVNVTVEGANWGLCCNSIHFVDMFCFFNNQYEGIKVSTESLSPGYVSAKRDGYVETMGTLDCSLDLASSIGKATLQLTCSADASKEPGFVVHGSCAEFSFEWDLFADAVKVKRRSGEVQLVPFRLPLLSESNHLVVESILSKCPAVTVPRYEQVAGASKEVISAFVEFLEAAGNEKAAGGVCPIT